MLKHYIEFCLPGVIVAETTVRPIASREAKVEWPKNAFCYRIFDREEVEQNGETLRGEPKNYGPRVIRGEVWPLERIKREMPGREPLTSNIEHNYPRTKAAVKCATGNWIGLEPGDQVVSE
jgi:hypothetical protein